MTSGILVTLPANNTGAFDLFAEGTGQGLAPGEPGFASASVTLRINIDGSWDGTAFAFGNIDQNKSDDRSGFWCAVPRPPSTPQLLSVRLSKTSGNSITTNRFIDVWYPITQDLIWNLGVSLSSTGETSRNIVGVLEFAYTSDTSTVIASTNVSLLVKATVQPI